ncbi:hypothetical protein [Vibrio sp. WXL210]|uniref:hypothetical protein n=1 Tax=Vibrio sp. WXL210 TaxID=3450709 RepID=UPI003EC4CBF8
MKKLHLLSVLVPALFMAGCSEAPSQAVFTDNDSRLNTRIENRMSKTSFDVVVNYLQEQDMKNIYNAYQVYDLVGDEMSFEVLDVSSFDNSDGEIKLGYVLKYNHQLNLAKEEWDKKRSEIMQEYDSVANPSITKLEEAQKNLTQLRDSLSEYRNSIKQLEKEYENLTKKRSDNFNKILRFANDHIVEHEIPIRKAGRMDQVVYLRSRGAWQNICGKNGYHEKHLRVEAGEGKNKQCRSVGLHHEIEKNGDIEKLLKAIEPFVNIAWDISTERANNRAKLSKLNNELSKRTIIATNKFGDERQLSTTITRTKKEIEKHKTWLEPKVSDEARRHYISARVSSEFQQLKRNASSTFSDSVNSAYSSNQRERQTIEGAFTPFALDYKNNDFAIVSLIDSNYPVRNGRVIIDMRSNLDGMKRNADKQVEIDIYQTRGVSPYDLIKRFLKSNAI